MRRARLFLRRMAVLETAGGVHIVFLLMLNMQTAVLLYRLTAVFFISSQTASDNFTGLFKIQLFITTEGK
jgi:hypothetical protein